MTATPAPPRPRHWLLFAVLKTALVAVLVFMMAITTIDVIGRDLLNAPLPSAYELTQLLMAASIFIAMPLVTAAREHVTISALDGALPALANRARVFFVNLVSAVVLGGLAWRLYLQGERLAESGNVTMFLRAPLSPVAYGGSALLALCAAIFLGLAIVGSDRPDGVNNSQ